MVTAVPGTPTITQARDWVGSQTVLALPADVWQLIYDSAVERQQEVTTLASLYAAALALDPDTDWSMPSTCREALLRRVARSVASRAYPLGQLIGGEEFMGAPTIARWDAEIEDKESSYRQWGVA